MYYIINYIEIKTEQYYKIFNFVRTFIMFLFSNLKKYYEH